MTVQVKPLEAIPRPKAYIERKVEIRGKVRLQTDVLKLGTAFHIHDGTQVKAQTSVHGAESAC